MIEANNERRFGYEKKNLNCNSATAGNMDVNWCRLSAYVILFFKGVMLCRERLNLYMESVFIVIATAHTPIQALKW